MTAIVPTPRNHNSAGLMAVYGLAAAASFHTACLWEPGRVLIGAFVLFLILMARARTGRVAFYSGLAVGLAIYGPQLHFFYTIFGPAALPLWLVLSFWLGLFLLLAFHCRERFGDIGLAMLAPFLWTGLEYFRGELYYLKFSWLNVGYSFANPNEGAAMLYWGVYGVGFLLAALAGLLLLLPRSHAMIAGFACAATILIVCQIPEAGPSPAKSTAHRLKVAGLQVEFPMEMEVPQMLDRLARQYPHADLLVMSEYTFDGPVPRATKSWCRKHQKYLLVGGKEPAAKGGFINMAYVVGPDGEIVFRQGKSVPIQFFSDGLPAPIQKLWDSPWGKLGICICYDLSYRRVVERLARMGAQAILVPTMDVADWGAYEHELHARVAPARAKEFGVPVIRLASSGVSQWIEGTGQTKTSVPFPGQQESLYGVFDLPPTVRLPLDIWLAPFAVLITAGFAVYICIPHKYIPLRFELPAVLSP